MVDEQRSFEEMILELESILKLLDEGDQPLEDMLKLYSRGVELAAQCRVKIDAVEDTIANDKKRISGDK